MSRLSKDALLGASDLVEREVELDSIGGSVIVRSLPAAYSNQAQSEALEMITDRHGEQRATVNVAKLEALQVLHGLVEPKLNSIEEAQTFGRNCGPAWRKVVGVIDEISGIDKATIEKTNTSFRAGGEEETRPGEVDAVGSGNGRPDLPVPAGA